MQNDGVLVYPIIFRFIISIFGRSRQKQLFPNTSQIAGYTFPRGVLNSKIQYSSLTTYPSWKEVLSGLLSILLCISGSPPAKSKSSSATPSLPNPTLTDYDTEKRTRLPKRTTASYPLPVDHLLPAPVRTAHHIFFPYALHQGEIERT